MNDNRKSLVYESMEMALAYLSSAIAELCEAYYDGSLFTEIKKEKTISSLNLAVKRVADFANPKNNPNDIKTVFDPRSILKRELHFENGIYSLVQILMDLKDNESFSFILDSVNTLVDSLAIIQERNQRYKAQFKTASKSKV